MTEHGTVPLLNRINDQQHHFDMIRSNSDHWITNTTTMTTTATTPVNVESNRVCCDPELSLSDDSENDAMHQSNGNIEVRGYLSKWTNYIYGWQPRYIVLKDGILSYYKSETESDFGCRGAISLCRAIIKVTLEILSLAFSSLLPLIPFLAPWDGWTAFRCDGEQLQQLVSARWNVRRPHALGRGPADV